MGKFPESEGAHKEGAMKPVRIVGFLNSSAFW